MKKEKILQELEAEQAEYEAVEYVAIDNQESEIENFKANVVLNVKCQVSPRYGCLAS